MAIALTKGGNISLTQLAYGFSEILVGLGWRSPMQINGDSEVDFELDACIFMLDVEGQVRDHGDVVFYNNEESPCGSVRHLGEKSVGGDQQAMLINLAKVPGYVQRVVIGLAIYEGEQRQQYLSQISAAYLRIANSEGNGELLRFDLPADHNESTAMICGEIYRYAGAWKFRAIGQGYRGGMAVLCYQFGIDEVA